MLLPYRPAPCWRDREAKTPSSRDEHTEGRGYSAHQLCGFCTIWHYLVQLFMFFYWLTSSLQQCHWFWFLASFFFRIIITSVSCDWSVHMWCRLVGWSVGGAKVEDREGGVTSSSLSFCWGSWKRLDCCLQSAPRRRKPAQERSDLEWVSSPALRK